MAFQSTMETSFQNPGTRIRGGRGYYYKVVPCPSKKCVRGMQENVLQRTACFTLSSGHSAFKPLKSCSSRSVCSLNPSIFPTPPCLRILFFFFLDSAPGAGAGHAVSHYELHSSLCVPRAQHICGVKEKGSPAELLNCGEQSPPPAPIAFQ